MTIPTPEDYFLLALHYDALRTRFAGWPTNERIAQVIEGEGTALERAEAIRAMFAGL